MLRLAIQLEEKSQRELTLKWQDLRMSELLAQAYQMLSCVYLHGQPIGEYGELGHGYLGDWEESRELAINWKMEGEFNMVQLEGWAAALQGLGEDGDSIFQRMNELH